MFSSTPPSHTVRGLAAFYVMLAAIAVVCALGVMSCFSAPTLHAETPTVTSQHLLAAATSGSAKIGPGFMPRCRETAVYIVWSAGVNAGAVTIESSYDPNYTGTWAPLQVVTQTGASRQDIVQITGVHAALQTRVSTGVTGGTVDTWAVCN